VTDDDITESEWHAAKLRREGWPMASSMLTRLISEVRKLQAELAEVSARRKEKEPTP
jgi:hypothetical protein